MTEGEIRVYLALLDLGLTSTGKIIDKSQITSSKVYLILERLEQKGFASHVVKNNVKYFQATNPVRILDYIQKKKEELDKKYTEAKKIVPDLIKRHKLIHEKQETTIYQGLKGIESAMFDFISDLKKGNEYVVLGTGKTLEKKFELLVRKFYMEKARRGIKTRLIYNDKCKTIKNLYKGIPHTKIKFVNKITPSTIAISHNKTLIITYGKESIANLIESRQIAESFMSFFESIWKLAKK